MKTWGRDNKRRMLVLRAIVTLFLTAILAASCGAPPQTDASGPKRGVCVERNYNGDSYVVCTFQLSRSDVRLFHSDRDGIQFRQFDTLARELDEQGKNLAFAMNGGMYHEDRSPVGFYRDTQGDMANVNIKDGPGNFHLKPNGVFWIDGNRAGIAESRAYLEADIDPDYATQSGPMLVIDGALHPAFNKDGVSQKRRNGVGVSSDGQTVFFAISDTAVTFHAFASLFRDYLGAKDALFLDGQVSRLYAPGIGRNEPGLDMGPIIGVVE